MKRHDHVKEQFKELGIMTVFSLYVYETIVYVKQNCKHFETGNSIHHYNTRNGEKIRLDKHRLAISL